MKTSHRRIALLTGASISALGVSSIFASPAFAAPHDTLADGTYAGTSTTADSVVICDLATNEDCFFGVIDHDTAAATAIVNSTTNGRIVQSEAAATVTLTMLNDGSAEVGAIAVATNNAGPAAANAVLSTAISQNANAGVDANAYFTNEGQLLIDAVAYASGSAANAGAFLNNGIQQHAAGTGTAAAFVYNTGTLTIAASAVAHGTDG